MTILGDTVRASTAEERPVIDFDDPLQRRTAIQDPRFRYQPIHEVLTDPCSFILFRGLSAARQNETDADRAWRIKQRKAKAELSDIDERAKSSRPRWVAA